MQVTRIVACSQVNIDGGPENWNHTVLAFLTHLVSIGVVDSVQLFRMLVGHTHNDQDQKFSRVSVALHGYGNEQTGTQCLTPSELASVIRNSYMVEDLKPAVINMSSVLDFDSWYNEHLAVLEGFGAAAEVTTNAGVTAREEKRSSHFRVALIQRDKPVPGRAAPQMPSVRFAEAPETAARGEWFPAPRPAGSDPAAPLPWCTPDKEGAQVLRSEPDDVPTRLRYKPGNWAKCKDFLGTLQKVEARLSWPAPAAAEWKAFLQNPPCALDGVPLDLMALVAARAAAAAAAPPIACATDRRLAVCPLITGTRTRKDKEAEVSAVLGNQPGQFDVAFSELELNDFAFALAHKDAVNAFTVRVSGKQSPPLELLELMALSGPGETPACTWRYWRLKERGGGTLKFELHTDEQGADVVKKHSYIDPTIPTHVGVKASEMLMVWNHSPEERATAVVSGVYTLGVEQLQDLQSWCVYPCPSPNPPRRADTTQPPYRDRGCGRQRRTIK